MMKNFTKANFYSTFMGNSPHEDPVDKWNHVRGSASSFLYEGKVHTDAPAGCPRISLLRSKGIQDPKELKSLQTFEVGFRWEEMFKKGMMDTTVLNWDDVCTVQGTTDEGFPYSGRPDHVVTYKDNTKLVFETKSITSVNKFRSVMCDGENPTDYVAQLVFYMDKLKIDEGYLAYGAFLWAGKAREVKVEPTVKLVSVVLEGDKIIVGGKPLKYTRQNQRLDTSLKGYMIANSEVAIERPENPGKVCFFCAFKDVCDVFDKGDVSSEAFVQSASETVESMKQAMLDNYKKEIL